MRVRWKDSEESREGSVWHCHPLFKQRGETDYEYAVRVGLCGDPKPEKGEPVLVAWDDRPGGLQAHTWDELEVIDEGARQEPVGGDQG